MSSAIADPQICKIFMRVFESNAKPEKSPEDNTKRQYLETIPTDNTK